MQNFSNIYIREPLPNDKSIFINSMKKSVRLHNPWVNPPTTDDQFFAYLERYCINNDFHKSYLIFYGNDLIGVVNLNEIVRGYFQSCYLGYYAVEGFSGYGFMTYGLSLVLEKAFNHLGLHRLEANIQPSNKKSINLVLRNGFTLEGYSKKYLKINDVWEDHERYAIVYEDWLLKYR